MGISTRFCKHFNLTPNIGRGSDKGPGPSASHTPCITLYHTLVHEGVCKTNPRPSENLTVVCDPSLPWPQSVVTRSPGPASWVTSSDISPLRETNISPREAGQWPHSWVCGHPRCSPPDVRSLVLMTESHDIMVTHLGCHGTLSTHIGVPTALTPSYYQNTNSRLPSLASHSKWVSFLTKSILIIIGGVKLKQ